MRKSLRMMRKPLWVIGAALLAVAATSSIALAAVNVKKLPTASFSGPTATVTGGEFSGLGNVEAEATLTVTGEATYTCRNPQGHPSPGQNPVEAGSGSSGPVGLGNASNHNGRGTIKEIKASVTAPATPTAEEVGCGGNGSTQWTVELNKLTATAAHLVIEQGGTTFFCRDYTLGEKKPATGTACP